ncbi:putative clathrin assembly protein At1g25240 [Triticum urartu]|uniref:putative clathrin assembly protein At1g25240 n=1 Tax=Triticum urartu TaxID=4572 RepID=UPI002043F509|nr:putative clathrin assembly protein At1g25240 [Triticum urartu]
MTTARQWWQRAAAAAKDKKSLCLTRAAGALRSPARVRGGAAELDAAVIRATSHDDRFVDRGAAARVLDLARASSPSPLVWALARRAGRTRCWAVALKALMLAHRLLLLAQPRAGGRVPFDLADFRDRSSAGLSALVRAYFRFLDARSLFAAEEDDDAGAEDEETRLLDRVSRRQHLLDLLMQIRPYGDGMERQSLVLDAMECAVVEIFDVYGQVRAGIAEYLVAALGGSAPTAPAPRPRTGETVATARRRRAMQGVRVLRKEAEQSALVSSYFELCQTLGVLSAAEFPAVERVPDHDIRDLEKLIMADVEDGGCTVEQDNEAKALVVPMEGAGVASTTVATKEWMVFDDDAGTGVRQGHFGDYVNPFLTNLTGLGET